MIKTDKTTEDVSKTYPDDIKIDMQKLISKLVKVDSSLPVTVWEGKFWGGSDQQIIGFGDLEYTNRSGNKVEWFYFGLALQKNYISIYVNAVKGDKYLSEIYKDRLGKAKVGKSSISFKRFEDINLDVLLELLKEAVEILNSN